MSKETKRTPKCKHDGAEFVDAYFSCLPNPVIVLHCSECDALRIVFGESPYHNSYDEE